MIQIIVTDGSEEPSSISPSFTSTFAHLPPQTGGPFMGQRFRGGWWRNIREKGGEQERVDQVLTGFAAWWHGRSH